jgi:bacteriophage HK97-gp10 putative tail-component
MPVRVEIKGLKQAGDNLRKLSTVAQLELSRSALFDGSAVIAGAVRAATYTTFTRRTGLIRSGFKVRVAKQVTSGTSLLPAFIVQAEQALFGANGKAVRAAVGQSRSRKKESIYTFAFYWRFLEYGTGPRRMARKPKASKSGRTSKSQLAKLAAWAKAKSSGAVTARPWVAPAFASSAAAAIAAFADSFGRRIDTEVNTLPK